MRGLRRVLGAAMLCLVQSAWAAGKTSALLYGWDPGLRRQCISSPDPHGNGPESRFFYTDRRDCRSSRHWTVAVQSEKELDQSCPGPRNQSFAINGPDSPVKLTWLPNGRHRKTLKLTTDFIGFPHPCGGGYFTNYVIKEQLEHGGGPFPLVHDALFSVDVKHVNSLNDPRSASRVFVGIEAWWKVSKKGKGKKFTIEINTQENWGDKLDGPAMDKIGDGFLAIDGKYPEIGIYMDPGKYSRVVVDVEKIFKWAVAAGYFESPVGGNWRNIKLSSVFVGSETYNKTDVNALKTEVWLRNWKLIRK